MINRRQFCVRASSSALGLAASLGLATGCAQRAAAQGLVDVKWERDTCAQCRMVLSDRRFAVQWQGGPRNEHRNFDDIGCALRWLDQQAWRPGATDRLWVADLASRGADIRWLDAKQAHYLAGHSSPMGYNYGARAAAEHGSIGLQDLRILLAGRSAVPA